jgi:putative serine protease PepD
VHVAFAAFTTVRWLRRPSPTGNRIGGLLVPTLVCVRPRALFTLTLALTLGAGCGGGSSGDRSTGVSTGRPAAGSEAPEVPPTAVGRVLPRAMRSVVAIKAAYSGGRHTHSTGVVTDAGRGLLLTSDHNVEGAESITVTLSSGAAVAAQPVARAQCDDLALLALDAQPPGLVGLKPRPERVLRPGDEVIALGYPADVKQDENPDAAKLAATSGEVSMVGATAPLHPLLPALQGLIGHQAAVSPGLSGGPLLSASGDLIGLTVSIGEHDGPAPAVNMSFATGAARINKLLAQLSPATGGSAYSGWEYQHRCHAAMRELARMVSEPDHVAGGAGAGADHEHEHGH